MHGPEGISPHIAMRLKKTRSVILFGNVWSLLAIGVMLIVPTLRN